MNTAPHPLVDRFGRVHTDLRVSLTDRCNLRCTYCMPAEGLDWLPRAEVLGDDEVVRLVRIAVQRLGVRSVRLTGGEPLLRRGLPGLVARLAALGVELSLTTNGIGLARTAVELREAGLDRVNVSLDTLRADRFAALTRRDRIDDVFAGLAAAKAAGLDPVKVNAVPVRGVNEDEIAELASFAVEHGYRMRFIESMPLDAQGSWDRAAMVTADEVLARLGERFELVPVGRSGNAPAEEWRIAGTDTVIGVIASVTRPFCGGCDRVRLTADGQLRNCLFATEESDLRALLRGGADDGRIEEAWRASVAGKGPGHAIGSADFVRPERPMSAIGG
ncbi:GTP 3',8-cyclase MoaA [Kitasatospora aureofaciens]|uniref:GTP 3',8-cyclase n=1 Tax=Kitasatospora aureofaciens TaxID=1894 RepID=A0A1E7N4T3_KITAU|nr:GTP 3',8-cyclase MoaA [Kitasatospora aureofaciens]ARF80909.1 GTP 3',8-cyclase MoaA [Kitasatospora aureofaciens]OEV35707.1 cyclic pyranopterin phosphate synthase [Kitasatospora aureofaciens]GGU63020.1 cyclic pyranopterin monophosphate synthase [Kitasatospora aureofaciens]